MRIFLFIILFFSAIAAANNARCQSLPDTTVLKTDSSKIALDTLRAANGIPIDSLKKMLARGKDSVRPKEPSKMDTYRIATYLKPIPFNRQYFHESKIDKELKKADLADGVEDKKIVYRPDTSKSNILTKAILKDAAFLQVMIENMPANGRDSFSDHQERIRYLNAVNRLLVSYNNDADVKPEYYKKLVANMHDLLIASNEGTLASFTVKNANVYTLDNCKIIFENFKELRAYLYTRLGSEDPLAMFKRLPEYAYDSFASVIVAKAAPMIPDVIFNYATSTNPPLNYAIHHTNDPFVQAIVKVADKSKAPLKAMAFLGDLYKGTRTIEEVDRITSDPDLYFKNLVRLKVQNDSIGRPSYSQELELRSLRYTREMNELHEATDPIRFKCIEDLNYAELYYVIVNGQDEIYTSSFLGAYKRLMEKIKPLKGNQMIEQLHQDHFRTFIRMCAGYNTLSDFLATMDDSSRVVVMSNFINNLQKGREDDLEDAVDVADAFGSITDTTLAVFLRQKVKENYEVSFRERSKKGMYIYSLLSRLFDGNLKTNDTDANQFSEKLGLNNINKVGYKLLVGDSGIVYQRVFFFGDVDGKQSYDHFISLFRGDKKWKVTTTQYWSVIASVSGKKIVIYANLPLEEPQDDEAIGKLSSYLDDSGIHPTIMVHRGHSYHLKTTLLNLDKYTRIVILGSCGGYHNLAKVLDKSPDAHIVSSKQTGTMGVNDEILRSLNNSLLAGQDANWVEMWRSLEVNFNKRRDLSNKEKFSDYVPPYKNLGALFIKAYRRMMYEVN